MAATDTTAPKIVAEEQANGRYKFAAVYPVGYRCLNGTRVVRSVRTWATKRAAVEAGRREFRQTEE